MTTMPFTPKIPRNVTISGAITGVPLQKTENDYRVEWDALLPLPRGLAIDRLRTVFHNTDNNKKNFSLKP